MNQDDEGRPPHPATHPEPVTTSLGKMFHEAGLSHDQLPRPPRPQKDDGKRHKSNGGTQHRRTHIKENNMPEKTEQERTNGGRTEAEYPQPPGMSLGRQIGKAAVGIGIGAVTMAAGTVITIVATYFIAKYSHRGWDAGAPELLPQQPM
jgi:hypothetical protein